MPRLVPKPEAALSMKALRDLLAEADLRQCDAAWMCGISDRQMRNYVLGYAVVPAYVSLILRAYRDKLLPVPWLVANLGKPPP